jgi:hypothetical protein
MDEAAGDGGLCSSFHGALMLHELVLFYLRLAGMEKVRENEWE